MDQNTTPLFLVRPSTLESTNVTELKRFLNALNLYQVKSSARQAVVAPVEADSRKNVEEKVVPAGDFSLPKSIIYPTIYLALYDKASALSSENIRDEDDVLTGSTVTITLAGLLEKDALAQSVTIITLAEETEARAKFTTDAALINYNLHEESPRDVLVSG